MMPPMMTVPPSCTTRVVSASRVENDGELVFPNACWATALTSCRTWRFTRPFEFTCGSTVRILPTSRYCTVFAVVGATALVCRKVEVEVRIGTDSPTRMCASRLSAAMMCGADSIFTRVTLLQRVEEDVEVVRIA